LTTIKNYTVIYHETSAPQRPAFDRSPTTMNRRVLNGSPVVNNNNNNNNNNTQQQQGSAQKQPSQFASSTTALGNAPNTASSQSMGGNSAAAANGGPPGSAGPPKTTRVDFVPRAALPSPAYRRSLQQMNSQHGLASQTAASTDMTKTSDFARMRLGSYGKKNQASLTSLELKPATVEGKNIFV
jgi:hypothetical protein